MIHYADGKMPVSFRGSGSRRHAFHLNRLTKEVLYGDKIGKNDTVLFLDSDAFPIRSLGPLIEALPQATLFAIQRTDNGEPR